MLKPKKRWPMILGLIAVGALVGILFLRSDRRILWVAEGVQLGTVFLSPEGELVVARSNRVEVIDAQGISRGLLTNGWSGRLLTAFGEHGFLAHTFFSAKGRDELSLIDWTGQRIWGYPTAPGTIAVSSNDIIYMMGQDSNLYTLRADGSLAWQMALPLPSYRHSMAVGTDGSLALVMGETSLELLEHDGTSRWQKQFPQRGRSVEAIIRTPDDGVLFAQGESLVRLTPEGDHLWQIQFPPTIPEPEAKLRRKAATAAIFSLASDREGNLYAHCMDGLVYALDRDGNYRWSIPRNLVGFGPEWITFTESGDAIFGVAEGYELNSVTNPPVAAGLRLNAAERNRRLVRVSSEGRVRWQIPLSGSANWFPPKSRAEVRYLWETRAGLAEVNPPRSPVIGPDGTIYFIRFGLGSPTAEVYAVRGD